MSSRLPALPPPMGSTSAITTSSSSYSGSSLFDKGRESGSPLMTPVTSDDKLTKELGPSTIPSDESFSAMDTSLPDSGSMPLIGLAPDHSVDIDAITPETMRLVMLLTELGSSLDAGSLLNALCSTKGRTELRAQVEQDLGKNEVSLEIIPQVLELLATEPSLDNILDALSMAGDNTYRTSTPPPAPRLKPTELDDGIPELFFSDPFPVDDDDGYMPAFFPPSGLGTSYQCVAIPGSMLFGGQAEPMPSFGLQASGLDMTNSFVDISTPRAFANVQNNGEVSYDDPHASDLTNVDVGNPDLYRTMHDSLTQSSSLLEMALQLQGGSAIPGIMNLPLGLPQAMAGHGQPTLPAITLSSPGVLSLPKRGPDAWELANGSYEMMSSSSSVMIMTNRHDQVQAIQTSSSFTVHQTPGGSRQISSASHLESVPSTILDYPNSFGRRFEDLVQDFRDFSYSSQREFEAGNLTWQLEKMLKENEAGNLVSSADLLECIYLSATKPKSHLRPESLSFEGDEDFFTGGDIVEPSSIAPEAGPSTLQSRVQLPFEPLNRQRRVRGHRKGVAALLFPDAHETRKARRASTVRTTDDPFLTSAGPGAGPSTRPLALPSRPKLQQRHSPSQIPRWSGLAHSSLSTPVRSTTPIGEPKSKYAAGLSGRGSSKTPATQPSWMFAPRVGKPRQRSPRTPSIRSRRSSGDNTSAIAVGDDASRGSLGPALAEPSSAGELQLSETENLGDIDIAPSAFGVPPLALIEALERQAAVSTLPTVVVAPIKVYIPTESKRVPPLAADSPVEGGDGGQGRLEYHQGSIPNLVDIPTISSFGSLTPSYSSSNLAGAGKIPSFASSVPRVVREGPPSSGFAASASHSFNTLHSGYAPRSRLLQTIDEEKGSPSRASPPRHTVPGAISSPTLESPPSARPAAKNSGLWRKGKISLAVKSLFSRVKNSSLRSGMVLNATLANDRSLEVAQEADVGAGFGTEAPVRHSLGSSGKGMGVADHVYRAVFHQKCGLQSLDGYGHEDLVEDGRAFDCASEAWMKAHTRTITGHDLRARFGSDSDGNGALNDNESCRSISWWCGRSLFLRGAV